MDTELEELKTRQKPTVTAAVAAESDEELIEELKVLEDKISNPGFFLLDKETTDSLVTNTDMESTDVDINYKNLMKEFRKGSSKIRVAVTSTIVTSLFELIDPMITVLLCLYLICGNPTIQDVSTGTCIAMYIIGILALVTDIYSALSSKEINTFFETSKLKPESILFTSKFRKAVIKNSHIILFAADMLIILAIIFSLITMTAPEVEQGMMFPVVTGIKDITAFIVTNQLIVLFVALAAYYVKSVAGTTLLNYSKVLKKLQLLEKGAPEEK